MNTQIQGDGIRAGLRPSVKKLLAEVGQEKINSLTVWREVLPYSKFVKTIRPDIPYDEIFHLSLNINGKYNLDKDGVAISFKRGAKRGDSINVSVPSNLTIQQLFDKTRSRMGENAFLDYTASELNCQHFIDNILSAIGANTPELKKFILQDTNQIIGKLGGKYLSSFLNLFQKGQELFDIFQEGGRQSGKGSNTCQCDVAKNNGLPICKIDF